MVHNFALQTVFFVDHRHLECVNSRLLPTKGIGVIETFSVALQAILARNQSLSQCDIHGPPYSPSVRLSVAGQVLS